MLIIFKKHYSTNIQIFVELFDFFSRHSKVNSAKDNLGQVAVADFLARNAFSASKDNISKGIRLYFFLTLCVLFQKIQFLRTESKYE